MWNKVLYIATGMILGVATLLTGTYGLSQKNYDIYESAMALSNEVSDLGFDKFDITDYKIRFYNGNRDYIFSKIDNTLIVEKEKPILDAFVGTAWEVDGIYQVVVPAIEKFSDMFSIFGMANSLSSFQETGNFNFMENEYGSKEHIATIWHEAFHAYQMTYYMETITNSLEGHSFAEDDFKEALIVTEIDEK